MSETQQVNYDQRSPLRSKKLLGASVGSAATVFGIPAGLEALPPDAQWWQVITVVLIPAIPVILQIAAQAVADATPIVADAVVRILDAVRGNKPSTGGSSANQ